MFRCGSPGHSRAGRGFPIRTSWDHSPVIDSPRLIADSYVLLRLLMPRHPPCALKNLTTKINKYYRYRENHDHRSKTGHQVYLKLHLIILRCSRPLCSSQTTTPSHPSTHRVFTAERFRPAQEQPETTRTRVLPTMFLVRILRSCYFRTQQCAKRKNPVLEDTGSVSSPARRKNVLCCRAQRRAPAY